MQENLGPSCSLLLQQYSTLVDALTFSGHINTAVIQASGTNLASCFSSSFAFFSLLSMLSLTGLSSGAEQTKPVWLWEQQCFGTSLLFELGNIAFLPGLQEFGDKITQFGKFGCLKKCSTYECLWQDMWALLLCFSSLPWFLHNFVTRHCAADICLAINQHFGHHLLNRPLTSPEGRNCFLTLCFRSC